MEKKPVTVKCIGKDQGYYHIQFPKLSIPVQVDENLYQKMLKSEHYYFVGSS